MADDERNDVQAGGALNATVRLAPEDAQQIGDEAADMAGLPAPGEQGPTADDGDEG